MSGLLVHGGGERVLPRSELSGGNGNGTRTLALPYSDRELVFSPDSYQFGPGNIPYHLILEEGAPPGFYDNLGRVYRGQGRAGREKILRGLLMKLDKFRIPCVIGGQGAGHTNRVREPSLLTDAVLARSIYWPGSREGEQIVEEYADDFEGFKGEFLDSGLFRKDRVKSDYIVALEVLRSGLGEKFIETADKGFLYRVVRGLIGMRTGHARKGEVEAALERLKKELPESLHSKIEAIRLSGGWLDDVRKIGYI